MENNKNGSNSQTGSSSDNDANSELSNVNKQQPTDNSRFSEQKETADAKYYGDTEADERVDDNVSNDGEFTNNDDDMKE